MKQLPVQCLKSEDGKISLFCDNDTPLGKLHDFLLLTKGEIVERMVKYQQEEQEASDKVKENAKSCDCADGECDCEKKEEIKE